MTEEVFKRKPGTDRFMTTSPVTLIFPTLITPKQFQKDGKPTGDPKFSATFLFSPDHPDLAAMKALWVRIIEEKWPGRWAREQGEKKAGSTSGHLKLPFELGNVLADKAKGKGKPKEFYRGKISIASKSDDKHPPGLAGFNAKGEMENYLDDAVKKLNAKKFYAGALVYVQFNFVTYTSPQLEGVTSYINHVLARGDGTPIPEAERSGGPRTSEVFKGYRGHTSTEDPTTGQQFDVDEDDGIPF
jgi:Protein of unknown function (DUF2815)